MIEYVIDESVRVLKDDGILFVQGIPYYLPELGVYLDQFLTFKNYIAPGWNSLLSMVSHSISR